jgi:predicted phage tail protein
MLSGFSNTALVGIVPATPTNLTATLQTGLRGLLTWTDNATDETGFVLERATDGVTFSVLAVVAARNNTGSVSYTDPVVLPGITYTYRVAAINPAGMSAYSNLATLVVPAIPAAPSPLLATAVRVNNQSGRVTLTWPNVANETGYRIQRSTSPTFTTSVVTTNLGPDVTSYTTGTISRAAQYYFRIQSFNLSGASAWVNATPFPIRIP